MFKLTINYLLKLKFVIIIATILYSNIVFADQLGVIPYRVVNQSSKFPVSMGKKYAKYMGVAAYIEKGFTIYNPYQFYNDLDKFGINPNKTLTRDDLELLSGSRYLVYIITGTITKTSKGYKSESILYSTARKDVIARSSVFANNLHDLAVNDMRELLNFFIDATPIEKSGVIDAAILVDTSYNILNEWPQVKKGILNFARNLYGTWSGSRIYLSPFSSKTKNKFTLENFQTLPAIERKLNKITPAGSNQGEAFNKSFSSVVKNINWRRDAGKMIIIVTNSTFKKSLYVSRYLPNIRKKNIRIFTFTLGKISYEDRVQYTRFAHSTEGKAFDATYHQILYDNNANKFNLYMEAGRLFQGDQTRTRWQGGLFKYLKNRNFKYAKAPDFAEEINFDSKKVAITPYNMSEKYTKYGERRVMGKYPLENNLSEIISSVIDEYETQNRQIIRKKPLARVLLSDGKISQWVDILKENDLDFFNEYKQNNIMFLLGVTINEKKEETYGITFNPYKYITKIKEEYIPGELIVSLKNIVSKPKYYMENGLLKPPVWFIKVKVEKINHIKQQKDIRDS